MSKRIIITLSEGKYAALKAAAEAKGVSLNTLGRIILSDWVTVKEARNGAP